MAPEVVALLWGVLRWEVAKSRKWRKTMSRRLTKALSLFLGILMFLFGTLKFFQPFNGWFDIQIQQSHLPHESILAGKLTECSPDACSYCHGFGDR